MRHFFLLLLAIVCLSTNLYAQNYRPFGKNSYVYRFEGTDEFYKLTVDSVSKNTDGDSVFYFNPIAHQTDPDSSYNGCKSHYPEFIINKNNLFGREIIKKPGGDYIFLVKNDTFLIRTQTDTISTWTFSNNPNYNYKARIKNRTTEMVLGKQDSIITIIFDEKYPIKISKNHGLIKSFAFLKLLMLNKDFDVVGNIPDSWLNLVAIPTEKKGLNFPDFIDFFNYKPGDQFGYYGKGSMFFSAKDHWEDYTLLKVLNKIINKTNDSIFIKFHKKFYEKRYRYSQNLEPLVTKYNMEETIIYDANQYSFLNANSYDFTKGKSLLLNQITYKENLKQFVLNFSESYFLDTCNNTLYSIADISSDIVFKQRFGLTNKSSCCEYYNDLVCYSINDSSENFGKCPDFDKLFAGIEDQKNPIQLIEISPNPANNEITIKFPFINHENIIRITDVQGKIFIQQTVKNNNSEREIKIDISAMLAGLYFVNMISGNGNVSSQKFLISR